MTSLPKNLVKKSAWHGLIDEILLALDTLRRNPVRSALTVLGIVIGIVSVIGVTAVTNGLNQEVLAQIQELGPDTIICYRFPWASLSRMPTEWFNRKELHPEWAEDIAAQPHVAAAAASLRIDFHDQAYGYTEARRGKNRSKNITLQGNALSITEIFDLKVEYGRFFDQTDDDHHAPVVMLGYDTTRTLFPNSPADSVGQQITVNGQLFTVVGTMEKRKQGLNSGANPEDNIVIMPVTTLRKLYPNKKDYVLFVKASSPETIGDAMAETREVLRRKRRLAYGAPDDFAIFTSDYFLSLWNTISSMIFIMMIAAASVGLIVGGIGVMNIMLVSVTERTREIGVRKAIGAKRSNILAQFLIESATLSLVGGVLGVLVGSGLITAIHYVFSIPASLSLFWIATGMILCAAIGIIFGVYPAWKAAALDPVEALRYE